MADPKKLADFVAWTQKNITGDEKGEAQIFLDRLFQAFGQPGLLDVGGKTEFRVRKSSEDGGGISFADYVWKPIVLIEMKKRGVNLQVHLSQAFHYWERLCPNRPRYVVLCNFDEFRVYDFDADVDNPVDQLAITELPERYGPLRFLEPGTPRPSFGTDRLQVTRDAAASLARCYNMLTSEKRQTPIERPVARKFILQMLVALFAEDIGLLEKYFVTELLEECTTPADTYDLIGGLFDAMNTPRSASGGRFKGVRYFNGGLFAQPARIELGDIELVQLRKAAAFNWSEVRPEIFGTLFEQTAGAERRSYGQHFTSPIDIMKIVRPTIVDPWREQIEEAKTFKRLGQLRERLQHFRVLDPACGSGNFLYIAYRELKRLEARIFERINEFPSRAEPGQQMISWLSARNFFGMDINPFAVEIAKVTMMIARKLAIDELHITEPDLPLDNLDQNFITCDALFSEWPQADVIIGNPPFGGAKLLKPQHGPDYVKKVRLAYPDVPGMADYCVYWFRKAHDHISACTAVDPVSGRAGLVGTQNIRNNKSRVGGLDHIVSTGTIIEAVDNQPWSGEANVSVSIANWVKTQDRTLLPRKRRLWFKIEPDPTAKKLRKHGSGPATKEYELNYRECDHINSALSDQIDVSGARRLRCNIVPQRVFQGITPGHKAFVLKPSDAAQIIRKDADSAPVIFPYLVGKELVTGDGTPSRFVINFEQRDVIEAKAHSEAFARVQGSVLAARVKAAEKGKDAQGKLRPHHKQFLERWWKLAWDRADMLAAIRELDGRYIVCSRVTKRPIFSFVSTDIQPGDALQVFIFADDYSFGILQSNTHWQWFVTKCSKLTERYRYTPESIFDTFPWPQSPNARQIQAVAEAGREVRRIRTESLRTLKGGLRALYRTLELPGANPLKDAHAALDSAVLNAYSFLANGDLLSQLLTLNLEVARRIEAGETVTAPGVPPTYRDPTSLVTADCIQP